MRKDSDEEKKERKEEIENVNMKIERIIGNRSRRKGRNEEKERVERDWWRKKER